MKATERRADLFQSGACNGCSCEPGVGRAGGWSTRKGVALPSLGRNSSAHTLTERYTPATGALQVAEINTGAGCPANQRTLPLMAKPTTSPRQPTNMQCKGAGTCSRYATKHPSAEANTMQKCPRGSGLPEGLPEGPPRQWRVAAPLPPKPKANANSNAY